jgi:PIN domain nuclease of toxin-antitoxin system
VRVFDSSALLALLRGETGGKVVDDYLGESGWCSAANWAEIAQKLPQLGVSWAAAREALLTYDLRVEPVTMADAEAAAALWAEGSGLSLADRLCLALGDRLKVPIVTCDKAWSKHSGVVLVR